MTPMDELHWANEYFIISFVLSHLFISFSLLFQWLPKLTKKKGSELDQKRKNLGKRRSDLDKKKGSDLDKSFLSITSYQSIEYWLIRNRSNITWKWKRLFYSKMKCSWKFFFFFSLCDFVSMCWCCFGFDDFM